MNLVRKAWLRLTGTRPTLPVGAPVIGRDAFCRALIDAAEESGSVLLFGGRQSGKSSILRRARDLIDAGAWSSAALRVPVYVDLMRLPHDATPSDFFAYLGHCVFQGAQCKGVRLRRHLRRPRDLAGFEKLLGSCDTATRSGEIVRVVLLVDETNRILAERFPRAFLDNLFALIYGERTCTTTCVTVFAGAQELYAFSEDGTSPIGSRAARFLVSPIDTSDILEFLRGRGVSALTAIKSFDRVAEITAGHAGLLTHAARMLTRVNADAGGEDMAEALAAERAELFQIWAQSLSAEARAVAQSLAQSPRISFRDSAQALGDGGLEPFRVDRAWRELQFTGIADRQGDALRRRMQLFWDSIVWGEVRTGSTDEQAAWALIERLELRLRALVRQAYDNKFGPGAELRMAKVLGPESWKKIEENQKKSVSTYRHGDPKRPLDILHFTYVGQLGMLIVNDSVWTIFKGGFRDKRQLEDMFRDIIPVRNERAHFRSVPPGELQRCKLRCEDLLAILGE